MNGNTPAEPNVAPTRRSLVAVGGFFALKAGVGVLILMISAQRLSVDSFATFSQLFLYLALLASVASGGAQNGVVREIAAAGEDLVRQRTVVLGGLLIWTAVSLSVLLGTVMFHDQVSDVLVGTRAVGSTVVFITTIALLSGIGNLLCSALSGAGRAPLSLVLQGCGLLLGGVACMERLWAGDGTGAVLAYALGPLITSVGSLLATRGWLVAPPGGWRQVSTAARELLSYSATFLVVVSALPLVLFGVRYLYRADFGTEFLGYWLIANRASDVTTQIVGIYLSQVYLPQATRTTGFLERRALVRRALLLCMLVTGVGAVIFLLGSDLIVRNVLSERFREAVPFILGYLIGDIFRVGGNVALFTALSRRRLSLFMTGEVVFAALVGAAILIGMTSNAPSSAYWGYLVAHGLCCLVVILTVNRIARL